MKGIIKRISYVVLSAVVLGVISFFIWTAFDYSANEITLTKALKNDSMVILNTNDYISIKPINFKRGKGYIFYPGAKVQPEAYIAKLSSIALSNNIQIIVPKMFKNLAFFGISKAKMVQDSFPSIKHWYVGGHSLGGSMACMFAGKNNGNIEGVLIFGTFSGTDISKCSFKVLSINGTEDGIFFPEKVENHKFELPKGTEIKYIKGMDHADIGNYGSQSGDKPSKLSDSQVTSELINATKGFFE